jgi:hypothetical protein
MPNGLKRSMVVSLLAAALFYSCTPTPEARDTSHEEQPELNLQFGHERVNSVTETDLGVVVSFEYSARNFLVSDDAHPSAETIVARARQALASQRPVYYTCTGGLPKTPENARKPMDRETAARIPWLDDKPDPRAPAR